jgi:hypothetical protein
MTDCRSRGFTRLRHSTKHEHAALSIGETSFYGEKHSFVPRITPFNEGLGLGSWVELDAAMNHPMDAVDRRAANLVAIGTMIADSPILVAVSVHSSAGILPCGFEHADRIILDWIIAASAACRPPGVEARGTMMLH